MATASELKLKVTKILAIVERLDDEHINLIEKDILLQEVRELYSDILLAKTEAPELENQVAAEEKEPVAETPAQSNVTPSEPPVIAIPFDAGDFDIHDLLDVKHEEEKTEEPVVEEKLPEETLVEETEEPVSEPVEEPVEEEPAEPAEETFESPEEPMDEIEEPEDDEEEIADEDEVLENEPELENEYFAQDESVSSDYSEDEPVAEEEPVEEVSPEPAEDTLAEEPEQIEAAVAEPEPIVAETPVEEPVAPQENANPDPIQEMEKTEHTRLTLGEQLGQSRQESLNDRFANNKPIDLSSRIGLKPITDIKAAIGLGERYRFTRMLFSGNGAAFDSTVVALNGMSNIEEAENYVRTTYNWDMESPVVADFMNIVRRRYM